MQVIAEFGQSNLGSVERAKEQATLAKASGADFAKWQMFDPARLAHPTASRYWDPRLGGHESQLDTYRAAGMLTWPQWREVKDHCDEVGITFLGSPFDLEAVEQLAAMGCETVKIASGEITHVPLLETVRETGMSVILSTGGATYDEIARALAHFAAIDRVTLMACTPAYPTHEVDAELWRIDWLARHFDGVEVGYSDHTIGMAAARAAAGAGATVIEKHVTLGDAEGTSVPDDKMALRITHLAAYVSHAIEAARMRGSERVRHEWDVHEMRRGIYAAIDIAEGHELGADHLVCLRPAGDGIASAGNWYDIVGRPARTALRAGEPIPAEWLHRGR